MRETRSLLFLTRQLSGTTSSAPQASALQQHSKEGSAMSRSTVCLLAASMARIAGVLHQAGRHEAQAMYRNPGQRACCQLAAAQS